MRQAKQIPHLVLNLSGNYSIAAYYFKHNIFLQKIFITTAADFNSNKVYCIIPSLWRIIWWLNSEDLFVGNWQRNQLKPAYPVWPKHRICSTELIKSCKVSMFDGWGPFYLDGLALILAYIRNYIFHNKVLDEITYPSPTFDGAAVEDKEWIRNFIPQFIGHVVTYPDWDSS